MYTCDPEIIAKGKKIAFPTNFESVWEDGQGLGTHVGL